KDIGIENTEAVIDEGVIQVNEHFQTAEDHIYAIGDVIGGMQLAHVASQEGIKAVEHMAGMNTLTLSYENVPRVTYSRPEVASIGLTEEEANSEGFTVKKGVFPFSAIGKALIEGNAEGFVKIIVDEQT